MTKVDVTKYEKGVFQRVLFYFGSWSALQKFYSLTAEQITELKNKGFMSSIQYLKSRSQQDLVDLLIKFGSFKKLSAYYRVSESFVKSLFPNSEVRMSVTPTTMVVGQASFSIETIKGMIDSFGSVSLFCYIFDINETKFRNLLKENGIHLSGTAVYDGRYENAKGRKAELFFKVMRGDKILKDFNEDSGHVHPVDFDDASFGLVNVKSASRSAYRSKTRRKDRHYWTFSVAGAEEADAFYVVLYDPKFEKVLYHFVLPVGRRPVGRKTITITSGQLKANLVASLLDPDLFVLREEFCTKKLNRSEYVDPAGCSEASL